MLGTNETGRSQELKACVYAGLLVLCVASFASAQTPTPTFLNLPVPAGTQSLSYGANANGEVVGSFFVKGTSGGQQLFVWKDGVTTLIGSPNYAILWASINNLGQVAYSLNTPVVSYLWDHGTTSTIGNFVVASINDHSSVVGCQEKTLNGVTSHHSVIWNDGVLEPILVEGDAPFSCAMYINNLGQIAGTFFDLKGMPTSDAYQWDQGVTTLIPALGGNMTQALGMNDAGQVVGASTTGNQTVEGFLWKNGVIQPLGFPAGETWSLALKIDAAGRIVGYSTFPWVWQNGVFTRLNGGTCESGRNCATPVAVGIVARGSIFTVSGNCINPGSNDKFAACIWNIPVPNAVNKR